MPVMLVKIGMFSIWSDTSTGIVFFVIDLIRFRAQDQSPHVHDAALVHFLHQEDEKRLAELASVCVLEVNHG